MPKETYSDYLDEIRYQREAWQRKPALRRMYADWYRKCVSQFAPLAPVVEVGSGSGNFKEFYPNAIATDVFNSGEWIDLLMDAESLSLRRNSIGNILAFDVLHHLRRPMTLLRRALDALKVGGRIVLCEPAVSPWSRFVYGRFHHEPIDFSWSVSGATRETTADDNHAFANMAIPEILLWKRRSETIAALPGSRIVAARKFGFILYPLTGGFGYRCFVPEAGLEKLIRIEDRVTRWLSGWLTGMRMLVVIEKVVG
jgi:SAM-dependent methyltransferase